MHGLPENAHNEQPWRAWLRERAGQFYQFIRTHAATFTPPWVRRATSLLSRGVALLVLAWMVYATYRDREVLLEALEVSPLYLLPAGLAYLVGFVLAVVSWRWLLRLSGIHYSFHEDYMMYTYMSVSRHVPIPYFYIASMMYNYQKRGTAYTATGLAMIATSILHIVAGVLVFMLLLLAGVTIGDHVLIPYAIGASVLVSVVLHPAIFRMLIRARGGEVSHAPLEQITWLTMLWLVVLNMLVLLAGGLMIFFCAQAVLDAPLTLLPVCVASWCLMVSATNLIFWMPSDFGLSRIILLVVFQGHLPVALVTAIYAAWRLYAITLELCNAGVATLVRAQQKGKYSL
jgi:hypothetical protein